MTYSVLMAGGIGSRFWPRSREAYPKQFLSVFGESTLLQQTLARIRPLVPADRSYVVTHERYTDLTRQQLPDAHILAEPISRNTAPCIAYAAIALHALDKDATMVVLPADHQIRNEKEFRNVLQVAIQAAQTPGTLITIGIKPTYAATGYGYIQFDGSTDGPLRAYPVRTFAEKPNLATAERFLDSGDFLWNSGIFIWRADAILAQMKEHLPATYDAFERAARALGTPREAEAIRDAYHRSARISVDYGVMERARNVQVVPGSFGWSDIGDWRAVYDLSRKNSHGNVLENRVIVHDASRCMVRAGSRLIVLVGIHDALVVDADDALLICHRESAQQVKNVVEYLHAHRLSEFL